MILAIGLALGAVYYFTFTFMIKKFDLKTPGREPATATAAAAKLSITEKAKKILPLLGGAANLISIDNCITRLRLEVKDPDKIDVAGLKNLGIIEVMKMANKKVHVVVGLEVEQLAPQIKQLVEEVAPKQEQPS